MESFSPQNYMSKNASNEILSNMKVVSLALNVPKVQKHAFLMCGWQVMIKSFSKNVEIQSGIPFEWNGQIG